MTFWATKLDADGIDVRMFNNDLGEDGDNVQAEDDTEKLFKKYGVQRGTPMGAAIERTLGSGEMDLMTKFKDRHGSERDIEKPVLVLIVTDGVPDDKDRVTQTIEKYCAAAARSKYGKYSLAFSFTQIGNSKSAAKWLADLDVDGVIGDYVDCTSRLEIEQQECAAKGITLTPMMWMVKVLVGAINPHYDQMDDAGAAATASGCHNNPFIAPPGYAPPGYQPIVTMDASQPPVHVVGTVRPSPAMMSHYNAGP